MRSLDRRSFLTSLAGTLTLSSQAGADPPASRPAAGRDSASFTVSGADVLAPRTPPDLTVLDLDVGGDKKLATRFTLFVPNHLGKDERVPLLILLHGLGETWDPGIGVYAWVERYGLGNAYARLRRPPVTRTWQRGNLLPDARLTELNASLAAQPFRGLAIACPFTPNVQKAANPSGALDAYADWIADVVIPRARKEAPLLPDAAHTALDGVSLGGFMSFELAARRPEAFGAIGGVQAAVNAVRLSFYAEKLSAAYGKAAKASIHIETSEQDPFRESNVGLSKMLEKKGVGCDLAILPGLHDQVFLREAGTMEMLLWHERRLRG